MQMLFSFESIEEVNSWRIINDGVMGGVSQSIVEYSQKGTMIFSGHVSLENNGGFASCRSLPKKYDLKDYEGITLKIKGDGQYYSFRLWTDSRLDGVSYVQTFNTRNGEWLELKLPFAKFYPQFRGRKMTEYPELDTAKITQFGILISDKQEGQFCLEIDEINVY